MIHDVVVNFIPSWIEVKGRQKASRIPTIRFFPVKPTPDDPLFRLSKDFPGLTENELQEVKEFLDSYLEISLKIFERIERDPILKAKLDAEITKRRKQQNQGL